MSRMTLSDRIAIEAGIYGKKSFKEIAKIIGKSPKYVTKEILQNRTHVQGIHPLGKKCRVAAGCNRVRLCGNTDCNRRCVTCKEYDCQEICSTYNDNVCKPLTQPPYVCNVCQRRRKCQGDREYYHAQQADAAAKRRYSDARRGKRLSADEMQKVDKIVAPLIKKGQPLTHILAEHRDEIPVSERTLYRYIDSGEFSIGNLDLRRKVGYRPRKKKKEPSEGFLNQEFRKDRTYADFLNYIAANPKTAYVEMDTVKGCREQGKRLLTLNFVEMNLMLMILMIDGRADTVVEQLDLLTSLLGLETFKRLFPVILTDNGSEFKHTREMEFTVEGERRTRIYYCDPQASWQKPHIEKNHEYIRYVLPKGKSFNPYTQADITLLMNHINSTKRAKLNGGAPYEVAVSPEFEQLKQSLGLKLIPADEIDLTPKLFTRRK